MPSIQRDAFGELKVAWQDATNKDYCKNLFSQNELSNQCAKFCGAESVPFMLGDRGYGFNQSAMDAVCLSPGEKMFDQAFVDQCHEHASSFTKVQEKMANLVAKLEVLEKAQFFVAETAQDATSNLRKVMKEEAEAKIDFAAGQENKIRVLSDLAKTALLDVLGGGKAADQLSKSAQGVQSAFEFVQAALKEALPKLSFLVQNCSTLVTGVGPNREYLLDMCATSSGSACIDGEYGRHLGCCCGYNPISAFGLSTARTSVTIPGTGSGSQRRLSSAEASFNICVEGKKAAMQDISNLQAEVSNLGAEASQRWLQAEEEKRNRYSDYFDRCGQLAQYVPTSTDRRRNPSNSPSSSSDSSSSDTDNCYRSSPIGTALWVSVVHIFARLLNHCK